MNIDTIIDIIESFLIKHELNLEGELDFGEYIWQSDSAQHDAINFAIDILNACRL